MTGFSEIAKRYEKDSLVQKSASDQLFDLLKIQLNDDVLDLGCGTGNLTKKITQQTKGKVVGVDASEGMIKEAKTNYGDLGVEFVVGSVEELNYADRFDAIFCNSAFQWFKHPQKALKSCFRALKANGRMGIQAPATRNYCPNFIAALEKVKADPNLRSTFACFSAPWLFLDTPKEYAAVFEEAGFEVLQARIDKVSTMYGPEEVFKVFSSGAAAGYLNEQYYSCPVSEDYKAAFGDAMLEGFREQADAAGKVDLVFYRVFLLAKKPQ